MIISNYTQLLQAVCISSVVSLYACKKRKLTPNASLTAFVVGSIVGLSGGPCTAALLTFFLTASKITSFGKRKKQLMSEEGSYDAAGYRNVNQVLCNSAPAIAIILFDIFKKHFSANDDGSTSTSSSLFPCSRACQLAVIAQFAGTNGDTFSSEIGVLSRSAPRLVLNPFRAVPAGTNGGVTLLGLGAAAVGGLLVGGASFLTQKYLVGGSDDKDDSRDIIFGSVVAAVGCSLVDSVLGMTLQYSGEVASRKAQQEDPISGELIVVVTEDPAKSRGKQISGWFNVLSNDGVNLVSALITTVVAYRFYGGI